MLPSLFRLLRVKGPIRGIANKCRNLIADGATKILLRSMVWLAETLEVKAGQFTVLGRVFPHPVWRLFCYVNLLLQLQALLGFLAKRLCEISKYSARVMEGSFRSMTVPKLRTFLTERGVPCNGKRRGELESLAAEAASTYTIEPCDQYSLRQSSANTGSGHDRSCRFQ